ncbi:MAG TPA: PAS domain S-box protein [Candidatus Dormibacteraeota bacterium]|nr:PAS domain S-box protein [Candidatus Dormibacteraeota bacterium]
MSVADRQGAIGAFTRWLGTWPRRYGFALVAVTLTTFVCYGLQKEFDFSHLFALFFPTILIVASVAGFWPGLTATLLSALATEYFFLDPRFSFSVTHLNDKFGLVLFGFVGAAISGLADSTRVRTARLQEFERVVEGLDEMIVVVDRGYRYLIANRAFLNYRGMKEEDVIGHRVPDILNPGVFAATVQAKLDECFRGKVVEYNLRYECPARGEREMTITCLPIDGPGGVDRVACILEDMTDRKQAEGALRDSEDRYRDLVENSEDLVCTHDLEGRLLTVNAAPARILGYAVEELLQIPMRDLLIPQGRELFDAYLERLRTTGGPEKGLLCVLTRGGEIRTWEYSNTLRTEGVAKPIVRGMAHDITERRRAELALQASGERYRTLFEKTVAAVGIVALDGRVIDCNDSWAKMFGHTLAADCQGQQIQEYYRDPADRHGLLAELTQSGVFLNREWELKRKDGSPLWVLLNSVLITEGESEPLIQSTMFDITERKQAEAELRRREQDYRQFVAQSSEGIFRQDLDAPLPIEMPEDELVQRILRDSYLAECNAAIVKMYGLNSVQDFLGRRLTEFVDPANPVNLSLTREYVRSGFRVLERESHEADVNGNEKVFRNSMIGIVEDGKLLRTWGIQRDVTEQAKLEGARTTAELALRASEEHYRLLVEQASDGIFLASANGRYEEVNSAGASMLGYTREEILKLSLADVLAKEEALRLVPEVARFEGGAIQLSEWKFRRKDGSFFPGEVCGRRLPDGRLQGILRDITERKQAEDALRRSEERFRVALKGSPITVFSQDRDLRYTWIYNPQLHWQHEVLGKTDEEIIGPKKAAALNQLTARVLRTGTAIREEVTFPQNGHSQAFDITIEPLFDAEENVVGITAACMDVARLHEMADRLQESHDRLSQEKSYLESEIQTELGFEEIIGQSPALRDVLKKARVVAVTDSTVLLLGETGTGKELVARSVRKLSARSDKPFVKLNCAAVPSGLLESELFGHEKGAFTGAVTQKIGRIELADKGTLFLDEIGDLPPELQPKLLRVLQDREFERLGGVRTFKVDVRIISATNRDLRRDIADKKFREDLFYRLNVFPIELPPLRERREDIPQLVQHFVGKHAGSMGKRITIIPDEAMRVLRNWSWPGNVRELENMIERMVILTRGAVLAAPPAELHEARGLAEESLAGMERDHIIRVLRETHGVLSGSDGAASRLGMKRTTLQSMMKRLGIEAHEYRRGTGTFGR